MKINPELKQLLLRHSLHFFLNNWPSNQQRSKTFFWFRMWLYLRIMLSNKKPCYFWWYLFIYIWLLFFWKADMLIVLGPHIFPRKKYNSVRQGNSPKLANFAKRASNWRVLPQIADIDRLIPILKLKKNHPTPNLGE